MRAHARAKSREERGAQAAMRAGRKGESRRVQARTRAVRVGKALCPATLRRPTPASRRDGDLPHRPARCCASRAARPAARPAPENPGRSPPQNVGGQPGRHGEEGRNGTAGPALVSRSPKFPGAASARIRLRRGRARDGLARTGHAMPELTLPALRGDAPGAQWPPARRPRGSPWRPPSRGSDRRRPPPPGS